MCKSIGWSFRSSVKLDHEKFPENACLFLFEIVNFKNIVNFTQHVKTLHTACYDDRISIATNDPLHRNIGCFPPLCHRSSQKSCIAFWGHCSQTKTTNPTGSFINLNIDWQFEFAVGHTTWSNQLLFCVPTGSACNSNSRFSLAGQWQIALHQI